MDELLVITHDEGYLMEKSFRIVYAIHVLDEEGIAPTGYLVVLWNWRPLQLLGFGVSPCSRSKLYTLKPKKINACH